jgi:hypothetical protein
VNAASATGTYYTIYIGTDYAAYRIIGNSVSVTNGAAIQIGIALNGDHTSQPIMFYAFQNGVSLGSVDVEAKMIELEITNVGTIYNGSTVTFYYYRLP